MADLKISELTLLAGSGLAADDELAIVDTSASETKKIVSKDLIQAGVQLIDDATIPNTKIAGGAPPGSIDTAALADAAVTAAKLADQSSGIYNTGLPATGAFVGQLAVDATDHKSYIWSGTAWTPFMGAAGLNTLTVVAGTTPVLLSTAVAGDNTDITVELEPTTAAGQFLAGPTATNGPVVQRRIAGADLPTATTTTKGGVVVNGNGLTMAGETIAINNTVAASAAFQVVTYDAYGLVTSGRGIIGADLPPATVTTPGVITPAPDLSVDVAGVLTHSNLIAAGTGTKVAYDANGHITASQPLDPTDIPDLDASKITSGALPTDRIADRSVTAIKLADYATAYIQDYKPSDSGNTIGQFWLNPLAQQIRMWDGNVWVPIGVGALAEQNLRFCGLFDATDGSITAVTSLGLNSGFKVGDVIPVMTEQLTGAYFVCEVPGNAVGQLPGVNFDAGDWIVGISTAVGWERIDTLNGGGGGTLDSLVDVTITTPGAGQVLTYDGAFWVNQTIPSATFTSSGIVELATAAEVADGTDDVRAVTSAGVSSFYLPLDFDLLTLLS